jgi:acetyl esterase/lipase
MFLGTVGAAFAVHESGLLAAGQAPTGGASAAPAVEKDVIFGKGGDVDLKLDVYRPAVASKRTAIIHYHGGGFTRGSKDGLAGAVGPLGAMGYVNIAAQYRLAGVAMWPAQIHDVKAAIRWTRANASSLGIDPARIVIAGYSAGGHLALVAAGTQNMSEFEGSNGTHGVSTSLAGCLAFYAVTGGDWPGFRTNFPMPAGATEDAWRAATPATYARNFPPTILHHGLADTTVPPRSSHELLGVLQAANIPSELHTLSGVPHAFINHPELVEITARLNDSFLERTMLHPKTYPPFGGGGAPGGAPR